MEFFPPRWEHKLCPAFQPELAAGSQRALVFQGYLVITESHGSFQKQEELRTINRHLLKLPQMLYCTCTKQPKKITVASAKRSKAAAYGPRCSYNTGMKSESVTTSTQQPWTQSFLTQVAKEVCSRLYIEERDLSKVPKSTTTFFVFQESG